MKLAGYVDEISRVSISGWAIDRAVPDRPTPVAIFVNGVEVTRIAPHIYRPDVKKLWTGATGNYGFEFRFNAPLSIFSKHHVAVRFLATGSILNNGEMTLDRIAVPPPAEPSGPMPVLLNGMGRSGTTLMMSRLSRHPEIVVGTRYPFEIKLASYYSLAFRTLVSTADRLNSTNPDSMTAQEFYIGFNPYNQPGFHSIIKDPNCLFKYFNITAPAQIGDAFRKVIWNYYDILKVDQGKLSARYFAEKVGLEDVSRYGPRVLFGQVREIFLVRDLRDYLCSAHKFWNHSKSESLHSMLGAANHILKIQERAENDTVFLRYEDCVMKPSETMEKVKQFLGLQKLFSSSSEEESSLFHVHATSNSPASSIGRWKTELTEEEIAVCNTTYSEFLERFGYFDSELEPNLA